MKPQDWWIEENPQLKAVFGTGLTEVQKQDLRLYYSSGDISSLSSSMEKIIQETTIEQYEAITGKSRYE